MLDILKEAISLLKNKQVGKLGQGIYVVKNAICYRVIVRQRDDTYRCHDVILAIRTNSGEIIGNSSRIEITEKNNTISNTEHQRVLSELIPMIPFSVFKESDLDLFGCKVIDSGQEESLTERGDIIYNPSEIKKSELKKYLKIKDSYYQKINRHYMGARLVQVGSKFFLIDLDRNELPHYRLNFFMAELPRACSTISEAYDILKPDEVKKAESKGVPVVRQGEFFFVRSHEVDEKECYKLREGEKIGKKELIREIRVGNSRPNRVEIGYKNKKDIYVSGRVSHTGREHEDVILSSDYWYKVIPNTSKSNLQLSGDID